MFWMSEEVEEDLRERFQEDYPQVKRYLNWLPFIYTPFFFFQIGMSILAHFLHIDLSHYPWWIPLIPFLVIAIPILIVTTRIDRKYQITKRLKDSLYQKRRRKYALIALACIGLLLLTIVIVVFVQIWVAIHSVVLIPINIV